MTQKTKILIGGLLLAALGSVIAGLYTTDEGRRTRRKVHKKARKIRNKTLQQVGELKVSAKRQYGNAKQAANELIDEGKELISGITGSSEKTGTAGNAGTSGAAGKA